MIEPDSNTAAVLYTVTINTALLRAASIVAARKDVRRYLLGVCLRPVGNALHYLSSNGAMVFIGADNSENGRIAAESLTYLKNQFGAEHDIILPIDFVARILKACAKSASTQLTIGLYDAELRLSADVSDGTVNCRCPEAHRYPDVHKCASIRGTERNAMDLEHIDCRYLDLAAKSMLAAAGGVHAPVSVVERSPGTLTLLGDNCAIVVMGCRYKTGSINSRLDLLGIGNVPD